MQEVAAAYGARVPRIHVAPPQPRTLLEMAIENAAEGCARESWAAVVATHQAARSCEPALRASMQRIAADERRHASLSFELAHWLDTRLDAAERRLVRSAYADAMAELRRAVSAEVDPELMRVAGLPSAEAATALLSALERSRAECARRSWAADQASATTSDELVAAMSCTLARELHHEGHTFHR